MLTYIKFYKREKYRIYNMYQCLCGHTTIVREDSVRRGDTKSCGCVRSYNASLIASKRIKNKGVINETR